MPPAVAPVRADARWTVALPDGRIRCDLCPRECRLAEGQRAFCFVRGMRDGALWLETFGRSTGFCLDPIEKKPLNHFLPGTAVLSFGTAGCNLGCRFCQNWDSSKSRELDRALDLARPEAIAHAADRHGARSVAFTYNDPVPWIEYALPTARACRERGVRTVAVTAGYIGAKARAAFFAEMDAANIDLKAFTEDFYQRHTASSLAPVLDTLRFVARETPTWLEVTTLLIPGLNDGRDEIARAADWMAAHVGENVPWHFTAFHPDYKMLDRPRTPADTLRRAREQALHAGMRFVYVGNVADRDGQSTMCPDCGEIVIERQGYAVSRFEVVHGGCRFCGAAIAGHFESEPGDWGARRMPVRLGETTPVSR